MAKRETAYAGRSVEEIAHITTEEFLKIIPSRQRRTMQRGFTPAQKILLTHVEQFKAGKRKKPVRTHCRDMIVVPAMLGQTLQVYSGKEFTPVPVVPEMLGHYLGEFVMTRKKVEHSAPGIGATKSSAALSVK